MKANEAEEYILNNPHKVVKGLGNEHYPVYNWYDKEKDMICFGRPRKLLGDNHLGYNWEPFVVLEDSTNG